MGSHKDKPFPSCPWLQILVMAKALGQEREIHIRDMH